MLSVSVSILHFILKKKKIQTNKQREKLIAKNKCKVEDKIFIAQRLDLMIYEKKICPSWQNIS